MRIAALTVQGSGDGPGIGVDAVGAGLNVLFGPPASGQTIVADLTAHALYGRRFVVPVGDEQVAVPAGELIVESRGRRYRLRRCHDRASAEHLTVAAVDGSPVDRDTVQLLACGLPPGVLRPLYAVSFQESPRLDGLLSTEFAQQFSAALWRQKWAPPTISEPLRPVHGRLRALELQVTRLARTLSRERRGNATTATPPGPRRASDYLARLTDGELVRLRVGVGAGTARVVTRAGDVLSVDSLWSTQRDQVYVSLVLAMVAALKRHGVRLPLVFDEPFARLDARSGAALVAALDDFARAGNQVLVFTARREAVARFAAAGAAMHNMTQSASSEADAGLAVVSEGQTPVAGGPRRKRRRGATGADGGEALKRKRREAG